MADAVSPAWEFSVKYLFTDISKTLLAMRNTFPAPFNRWNRCYDHLIKSWKWLRRCSEQSEMFWFIFIFIFTCSADAFIQSNVQVRHKTRKNTGWYHTKVVLSLLSQWLGHGGDCLVWNTFRHRTWVNCSFYSEKQLSLIKTDREIRWWKLCVNRCTEANNWSGCRFDPFRMIPPFKKCSIGFLLGGGGGMKGCNSCSAHMTEPDYSGSLQEECWVIFHPGLHTQRASVPVSVSR